MIFASMPIYTHSMPMNGHGMFRRRNNCFFSSPCAPRNDCFFAGGLPLLLFFLAFFPLILPLFKIAMCILTHVIIPVVLFSSICGLVSACVCDDDDRSSKRCCFMKKMCGNNGKKKETVRDTLAKEKTTTAEKATTDWSCAPARVEETGEDEDDTELKIALAAPGVRPSDLRVSIVDNEISVKGASTR